MLPHDVLVVGESLVDVVHDAGGVAEHVGGSAANVAVALSRLGVPTMLATRVGSDERGRRILDHLRANAVELYGDPVGPSPTSTATARIGSDGAATYTFDLAWDLPPVEITGVPSAVHVCSIGAVLAPGCSAVLDLVERVAGRAAVSYDLNLRPQITGLGTDVRERIASLVAAADVVKASDEDLALFDPHRDVDEVARRLLAAGPAAVVVTRGGAGATWFSRDGSCDVPVPRVEVVDTVAAGDTFGATVIAELAERGLLGPGAGERLADLPVDARTDVLRRAAAAAAVTVSRAGADPPYRAELADA